MQNINMRNTKRDNNIAESAKSLNIKKSIIIITKTRKEK
jgi:hypothetical protein